MLHPQALQDVLRAIPADVWRNLWFEDSTVPLRSASKALRLVVDGMLPRLPASARMSHHWWFSHAGLPNAAKWTIVLQRILALAASTSVTKLELLCTSRAVGLVTVFDLCPDLRHLSISSVGRLGPIGTAVVAQGLQTCTALRHLQMRRNDMRAQGVRALLPTMRASPNLQHLDLGMNGLGNSGAWLLAPVLPVFSALTHLDLSGNAIQDEGATALAEHIAHCPALTLLDLGHNDMRAEGVAHLALALPLCRRLAHLDVSNNRCAHLDALADALAACPALAHLNVSYNSLTQHAVQHLASMLSTATALRSLFMHMCVRGSFHHILPVGLGMCTNLTDLRLNFNSIGSSRAADYALRLQLCPRLVLLDLRGNDIFDGGAQALAASLQHYAALAELVLPNNGIGFLGAAALLTHSSACPTLAVLDLSHNAMRSAGLARLHPAVHRLLAGRPEKTPQPRSSPDFEALLAGAARCTALRTLDLASNHMSAREMRSLRARWGASRAGLCLQDQ